MDTVLQLLKLALGITHNLRDDYFNSIIRASQSELSGKGVHLNLNDVSDQVLLCDYVEWNYRKRLEDTPLAQNLRWRIRNRQTVARVDNAD